MFRLSAPGAEVSVNDQGRVTIPVQVRRAAGIEAGVPLVVYVEDGRVVIETREQPADRIRRDVAAAWTGTGSVVDELIAGAVAVCDLPARVRHRMLNFTMYDVCSGGR